MKGASSSRKWSTKVVYGNLRQKGGQLNSYTMHLWNNMGKGSKIDVYATSFHIWLAWHLVISIFVFIFWQLNQFMHFFILVWFMSWGFFLAASNFSILVWSLKIKCKVLHVQHGDIKKTSSIFWSRGITRTQENSRTVWGKDLYCCNKSGTFLMLGYLISTLARLEYTHG